jgi:hypothetical protein
VDPASSTMYTPGTSLEAVLEKTFPFDLTEGMRFTVQRYIAHMYDWLIRTVHRQRKRCRVGVGLLRRQVLRVYDGTVMSPDWADEPEAVPYSSLDNPQSLNLYTYVLNNPLSHGWVAHICPNHHHRVPHIRAPGAKVGNRATARSIILHLDALTRNPPSHPQPLDGLSSAPTPISTRTLHTPALLKSGRERSPAHRRAFAFPRNWHETRTNYECKGFCYVHFANF